MDVVFVNGSEGFCSVKFKAGLMRLQNGKMVADPRKGTIKIVHTKHDNAVHLLWYSRTDASVDSVVQPAEIDMVFLPPDQHGRLSKIPVPNTRVYRLESSNDAHSALHIWMQEPSEHNDEDVCRRMNSCLSLEQTRSNGENGQDREMPPLVSAEDLEMDDESEGAGAADMDEDEDEQWDEAHNISVLEQDPAWHRSAPPTPGKKRSGSIAPSRQQFAQPVIQAAQLAQALRAVVLPPPLASNQPPGGSGRQPPTGVVQAADLAAILAGIAGGLQPGRPGRSFGPALAEVLKPDLMVSLLSEDGMLEKLSEYLPDEHRNQASLIELARSAQLRQQMNQLSSALMNGQLDLSHFGLASRGFTTADFLEAIQESVDEEAARKKASGQ